MRRGRIRKSSCRFCLVECCNTQGGLKLPFRIKVFGDSHAMFFFNNKLVFDRLRLNEDHCNITGKSIPAASVAGFRPKQSTLRTKDKILEGLSKTERLTLAFGQVDLELGFYYRLLVKKESVHPDKYADWLADIYSEFIKSLPLCGIELALKGVNLTVFSTELFFSKYVSRIILSGNEAAISEADIAAALLSEDDQNGMHERFNANLFRIAGDVGAKYFDINDAIATTETDSAGPKSRIGSRRLSSTFRPGRFDHHLVDSLEVRRIHLERIKETFTKRI